MQPAPTTRVRVATAGVLVLALVAASVGAARVLRPRQSLAVLGDSMVAMARAQITDAGHAAGFAMSVEGIPGIPLSARMGDIADLGHHGSGPVVVELGTNDVLSGSSSDQLASRIDRAVGLLVADPCVVFVGVGILYDVDGRAHGFNEHLRSAMADHPNLHLFDWETEFRQHPDWTSDSVHLRPEHLVQYADGIVDAVRDSC